MKNLIHINMNRRRNLIIFMAIFFLSITGNFKLFAQGAEKNSCLECHSRTVKKDILHGPTATDCSICHVPNGQKHPQEDVSGFTYYEEGAQLCYSCHTELESERKLKYVHKPVKNGECSECHEVHSSNDPKFVFTSSPDLCFFCHSEYDDKRETAKIVHTASYEGDACIQCHTPHASAQKRLLTDKSKQLCLNCHDKKIVKDDGKTLVNMAKHLEDNSHFHKALNKRCTSCHNAHYGDRELLLTENFTVGSYVNGVTENFTLCFDCHDSDLLNVETTNTATLFREGEQNLHYLHIKREKGRNCTTCHDVHAANNSKLIATTVKFGRWDMPLNYIENENGGTCATGCHKEQSYTWNKE